MKARFLIGIDLGTTNCALSYVDLASDSKNVTSFKTPQWDGLGVVASPLLPSFIAFLTKGQIKRQEKHLNFHQDDEDICFVLGLEAKNLGVTSPERVVSSAKSWLVHKGVDATSPILPWHSDTIVGSNRISPVDALYQLLLHLKRSWDYEIGDQCGASFKDQSVVVTVPASFDAKAQQLTLRAAHQAGFPQQTKLLEEPLAAFYTCVHQDPSLLEQEGSLLVCDIGGGTTDFTLLETKAENGAYKTKRVKVGPHILLGGDNIDLAIAHRLERQFLDDGEQLPSHAWAQLVVQARLVKEKALASQDDHELHISLDLGGSELFSSTKSTQLSSASILKIVEDFVPSCKSDEYPRQEKAALKEWGLPYSQEFAITKHLAKFLEGRGVDSILFAGGSTLAPFVRQRIMAAVESWQDRPLKLIDHDVHSLAVSLGACYYQMDQLDKSIQIEADFPYNLVLAAEQQGSPVGICIVAKGQKYGKTQLIQRQLKGLINRKVQFELFRKDDEGLSVGDIVPLEEASLIGNLSTVLKHKSKKLDTIDIAVSCTLHLTGILELSCHKQDDEEPKTWPITFDLQGMKASPSSSRHALQLPKDPKKLSEAINKVYGKSKQEQQSSPKLLTQQLEEILGQARKDWNLQELRAIWQLIAPAMHRRSRSQDHEAQWLYLAGFSLRPGFGTAGDSLYMEDIWKIFSGGPAFPKETRNQVQWFIMWRRISGGLNQGQQEKVFTKIWPLLRSKSDEHPELYLLAGSLERLEANKKTQLGKLLVNQLEYGDKAFLDSKLWCLARLSSRWPLYGEISWVLRPSIVESWLEKLLAINYPQKHLRTFKLLLCWATRKVGDREFDISAKYRDLVLDRLAKLGASEDEIKPVKELIAINRDDQNQLFGEELPYGLLLD